MKKRSNPIPLICAAVLCFMLIGYLNMRSTASTNPQAPTPQTSASTPDPVGAERKAPSASDLQKKVEVGGPDSATPLKPILKPGSPGGPPPGGPDGPRVPPGKGQTKPPKPKPNDASISTQWWSDDTNKKVEGIH